MKGLFMKEFVIRFFKVIGIIIGLIGGTISISMAMQDINKWYFAAFGIIMSIFSVLLFFLLGNRIHRVRGLNHILNCHLDIFQDTHNSWHMYKRFVDAIIENEELDVDELLAQLRKNIADLVSNFRHAIISMHPFLDRDDFRISLKLISYKDVDDLDLADHESYKELPFLLKDISYYRDTSAGPVKKEDIIDNLDFDTRSNPQNIDSLRKTLFWDCFVNKKVTFVDSFDEDQQKLTTNYKSGMVAPVVLHEIPFALLCVGSQKEKVFRNSDCQLVCTFVDALAEYFRLERTFTSMVKSRKIVVLGMDDSLDRDLQNLLAKKSQNASIGDSS